MEPGQFTAAEGAGPGAPGEFAANFSGAQSLPFIFKKLSSVRFAASVSWRQEGAPRWESRRGSPSSCRPSPAWEPTAASGVLLLRAAPGAFTRQGAWWPPSPEAGPGENPSGGEKGCGAGQKSAQARAAPPAARRCCSVRLLATFQREPRPGEGRGLFSHSDSLG